MTLANFKIESYKWRLFRNKVGNASEFMRNVVDSVIEAESIIDENALMKLAEAEGEHEKTRASLEAIKAKIAQLNAAEQAKQKAAEHERTALEDRTLRATTHRRVKGEELL